MDIIEEANKNIQNEIEKHENLMKMNETQKEEKIKQLQNELLIKRNRKSSFFAITGGFLEIKENKITILADYAIRAEDIEVAKAKQAQERAQDAMRQ